MDEITPRERMFRVMDGKTVDKTPVGSFTSMAPVDLMNLSGSSRPEADTNPEKMATLAISAYKFAGFETVRYPFDMVTLGEAIGCEIDIGTKERTPSITDELSKESIEKLEVPNNLLEKGRIPTILEASRIIKEEVGDELPTIVGVEGPIDLASNIAGIKTFMKWLLKDRARVEKLLDICTDVCIEYANACLKNGADAICIAEAVASPDLLPPYDFENLLKPRYTKTAKKLDGYCVLHVCGKTDKVVPHMVECGFNGIVIEENIQDLKTAVDTAHKNNNIVIGNVSTSETLFNGTPEQVKSEAFNSLKNGVDVLAPGCGIAPESPLDNLKALVQARNEYCEL
ncbi:MAG: methylcobamide:CoM methyltransferase MtaA [Methanohalobium sp.]|uniref:methylcobamide:CoM methyltransferase MtaA n=1 Tax=Methanohalobium sp. TaxID=2837493 RepID=UPI00397DFEB4